MKTRRLRRTRFQTRKGFSSSLYRAKKRNVDSPLIEVGEFLGYLVKNMINNDSFETEEE